MKLEAADILSAVGDSVCTPDDSWVIVEAPIITAFKIPGDYSTFSVISNPWEKLTRVFNKVIEIYIEEGQKDWSLKVSVEEEEKEFYFHEESHVGTVSREEEESLVKTFGLSHAELEPVLRPGTPYEFCKRIGLPYLEMEDQDMLLDIIPKYGKAILTSQLGY